MIAVLLLGCVDPDPVDNDARHYIESSAAQTLEDSRRSCLQIQDPELHGLCLSDLVEEHGKDHPLEAPALCEAVNDPNWRDECYFRLAEAMPISPDPEEFLARCRAAGQYEHKCRYHCLPRYGLLLRQHDDGETAFLKFAELVALMEPVLGPQRTAWSQYGRVVIAGEDPIELQWCERLESRLIPGCQRGLSEGLSRRLEQPRSRGPLTSPQ